MPDCDIFPPQPGDPTNFLGTVNVEITPEGAVPAFDHGEVSGSVNPLHYFVQPGIETRDNAGNPALYVFANKQVYIYSNGALAIDQTFADVVQGCMIFGVVAASVVTKRLLAFFGDSVAGALAGGGHAWRDLSVATNGAGAGWSYHVGATAIEAFLARNYGPDGMLVTGAAGQGRTIITEWNLEKIVQGLYDGTTSNIGGVEPVGNGDWPVIGLSPERLSFIAGTGAGAFKRNTVDKFYEPLRPLQELLPHGLNCKAMAPTENGVAYALADGRVFENIDGRDYEITPLKGQGRPKDTQRGRVSFIAHRGDRLAIGYEIAQSYLVGPRAADIGIRVFRRTAGTWTEITSGVTDGSLATPVVANMNAWGGTATDRLLVTSPVPLACIIPRVTRNPNANANSFTAPKGTAAGAAETGGALSVSLGSVVDNTILKVAGTSLVLTGMPPAAAEQVLGWDAVNPQVGMAASVTLTGLTTVNNVYAYEWAPLNTTAMSATTTIDEIDFPLLRPGYGLSDASGPFTQANDFSARAQSGMLSEIYFGEPIGLGAYRYSNPYTIFTRGGGVWMAVWTTAASGALTNGGQFFFLGGRFGQWGIAEGETRDPRRTRYPRLCQWTTTEPGPTLAINDPVFRDDKGNVVPDSRAKKITGFTIHGEDIQTVDQVKPLVSWRMGRGWHKFPSIHGPAPLISKDESILNSPNGGYKAALRFLIQDESQLDLWAPIITRITMHWEYADEQTMKALPAPAVAVE